MVTMLYDADTLKPQLLISEDIENGDIGKKFLVINGACIVTGKQIGRAHV